MARGCTVCARPDVVLIEAAIRGGMSKAAVSRAYGLGKMPVQRHASGHMLPVRRTTATVGRTAAPGPVLGPDGGDVQPAQTVRERLEGHLARLEGLLASGDLSMTLSLASLKEVRLLAESLAKQFPAPDVDRDFSETQDWAEFATAMADWVTARGLAEEWGDFIHAQLGRDPDDHSPSRWQRDEHGRALKETA
jgi:hypothetical protein